MHFVQVFVTSATSKAKTSKLSFALRTETMAGSRV
jgi:hypothetical protein